MASTSKTKIQCSLPDVKSENYVAARSCLQKTLSPIGAVVHDLSIQEDQNSNKLWRVTISATGAFPEPETGDFVMVRKLLNQNAPSRAVLRQVTRTIVFTSKPQTLWAITYGVKKETRIQRAVATIINKVAKVVPCLSNLPTISKQLKKCEKLSALEKSKEDKRKFYQLRQLKKAGRPEVKFVQGETLYPTTGKERPPLPVRHNAEPFTYAEMDLHTLAFQLRAWKLEDLQALSVIHRCKSTTQDPVATSKLIGALAHIKNRCPAIRAQHVPKLLKMGLEAMGLTQELLSTFTLKTDISEKVQMKHWGSVHIHTLCTH